MKSNAIQEINDILNGELAGHAKEKIDGPEELDKPQTNHITFINSPKYA